jgi:hypothetical protein
MVTCGQLSFEGLVARRPDSVHRPGERHRVASPIIVFGRGTMSDEPKPEADALEQAQSLVDDEDDLSSTDDVEVPEADLLDQRRRAASSDNAVRTSPDLEVPEADAAEQRRAVVDDEEDRPD